MDFKASRHGNSGFDATRTSIALRNFNSSDLNNKWKINNNIINFVRNY